MNKILLLAGANIRKAKGQTVILAALFLVSAMMLNIGLTVLLGFGSFFDSTAEELNTSDAYFFIPEALYTDEVEQHLASHVEISTWQKNKGLVISTSLMWKNEPLDFVVAICDKDEPRNLSNWKFVGDTLSETPDAIYVPYIYKLTGGYALGSKLTLTLNQHSYQFTVAGYTECIYQDRMFTGDVIFIPGQRFEELYNEYIDYRKVMVFANGIQNYAKIESELLDLTGLSSAGNASDPQTYLRSTDYASMKNNRTSMPAMMSVMLIVFTAVIAVVCLLVIRFRISNSIEEDMQKIGSLQSIGYTSRQITLSIMVQYAVIAFAACFAGIIPAYLALPFVSDVFAQQSGLFWAPGFMPVINLVSTGTLTVIVIAVAFIAALRIRRISPVQALRGGITTHSFKRNHIPLEKSRLPLTMALSCKSVLQGLRQSMTMFVIVIAVSFTAIIAVVLYYNAAIDLSTFEKVPGIERANALIIFKPDEDIALMKEEVLALPNVVKAQYLDSGNVRIDDVDAGVIVMEEFSQKETVNVYEGVFPRYDNEIAIAGLIGNMIGKGIGDEVLVGKDETPYLITGYTQGMEAGSLTVYLTLDGMRKITPDFSQSMLYVYLAKGTNAAVFVEDVKAIYGERLIEIVDADVSFAEGVSSFASIVSLVGLAILIVAGFVVILVLYFVISSAIIRRHRELGIQKAIGFTSINLMNQITIGFALPLTLGAAAGCVLGTIALNPLMSIGMSSMGIMKANYIINPAWVIATGFCIVVLSYLTSMLITWRIRKISAYALVTE